MTLKKLEKKRKEKKTKGFQRIFIGDNFWSICLKVGLSFGF